MTIMFDFNKMRSKYLDNLYKCLKSDNLEYLNDMFEVCKKSKNLDMMENISLNKHLTKDLIIKIFVFIKNKEEKILTDLFILERLKNHNNFPENLKAFL